MTTSDTMQKLCERLQNAEDSQETGYILREQSLLVRSYFALLAGCVPSSSTKYPLAQKILEATRSPIAGKTIVTWNINSLRAGIVDDKPSKCQSPRDVLSTSPMGRLITATNPDIICLQETKLQDMHIECFNISEYYTYWNNSTARKGYSGVAIWSKDKPIKVSDDLIGAPLHLQNEGRILTAYYADYAVVNTYTPNTLRAGTKPVRGWDNVANGDEKRKKYKEIVSAREEWDKAIYDHLQNLKDSIGRVIFCGDLNIARGPKDIHTVEKTKERLDTEAGLTPGKRKDLERRYKDGQNALKAGSTAGLRHEERKGIERILANGFGDVYRELHPEGYGFTYWDVQKKYFRGSNNGWRIDYFILSDNLLPCVESIDVYKSIGETPGTTKVASDHAPLVLKFYPNFICKNNEPRSEGKTGDEPRSEGKTGEPINFNDTTSVYLSSSQRTQLAEAIRDTMSSIKKVHGAQCIDGDDADLLNKLTITKKLGSGSFGMVYAGCAPQPCDENSYKFAVKLAKIAKTPFKSPFSFQQQPWHEIIILRDMISPLVTAGISPNLPLISDVFTCNSCNFELHGVKSKGPCMIILTELATGGALSDWLSEDHSQAELYSCLFQVMAGMHALQCHTQVWNNDIKKENILCYKVKPGGYWEYQIHGENFYVPNYGIIFVINDFGVSTTFNPDFPFTQNKKSKYSPLGARFAMIMDGMYSPLNATQSWSQFSGVKESTSDIAWGIPSKEMQGVKPYPQGCATLDVKEHSRGGMSVMELKTKKILSTGVEFTSEQKNYLESRGIPTDLSNPDFYKHPEIIPPLEFRWDTQDTIRMFTGGKRSTQPGMHKKPDTITGDFLTQLQKYVFFTGPNTTMVGARLRCAGMLTQSFNIGAYNINPATDIAGYFLTDFFTKVHDFTKPQEDQIVLATYNIS